MATFLLTLPVLFDAAYAGREKTSSPVFERLAAHTARIDSADGARLVYHHPDGRVVRSGLAGGVAHSGYWWIDDAGRYCIRFGAEPTARCYRALPGDDVVRFLSPEREAWSVRGFVPGDVHRLLDIESGDDAQCDCRPNRRRGARRE